MPARKAEPDPRKANVRKVADAAAELQQIENALADVVARAPALLAQVKAIRERIEKVVGEKD